MQGCCQQQSVMLQKGQHTPTLLEEPYTFEALPWKLPGCWRMENPCLHWKSHTRSPDVMQGRRNTVPDQQIDLYTRKVETGGVSKTEMWQRQLDNSQTIFLLFIVITYIPRTFHWQHCSKKVGKWKWDKWCAVHQYRWHPILPTLGPFSQWRADEPKASDWCRLNCRDALCLTLVSKPKQRKSHYTASEMNSSTPNYFRLGNRGCITVL